MQDWELDKLLTDRAMPHVQAALGCLLFKAGNAVEDTKEATDLRILNAQDQRVAVRLRSDRYRDKYGGEITLRYDRPSGTQSEVEKIMMGFAQWFFYGFIDDSGRLIQYTIINLNGVRLFLWEAKNLVETFCIRNADNSSTFLAIPIENFPKWAIAKQWRRPIYNKQTGVKQISANFGKRAA